jgi:hypothetical protein
LHLPVDKAARYLHTFRCHADLVVEVRALLEALGFGGSGEVALDDVEEAVVVGGGATGVLDQQRPRVPEAGAHRGAERAHRVLRVRWRRAAGYLQVGREIHHGEVHGLRGGGRVES